MMDTRTCTVLVGMGLAGLAAAEVVSTFDADAEGWATLNDARDPAWTGDNGNPAGAFTARDRGTGDIWYYSAPGAYLGDRSANVGGALSWDILGITGDQTSISPRADVMLTGAGLRIGLDAGVQPVNDDWTSWTVGLSASEGWAFVDSFANGTLTGNAVSAADFSAVLASLDGLYIRGEYTNGADRTALDNVSLIVPTPGGLAAIGAAGLVVLRRRRNGGAV